MTHLATFKAYGQLYPEAVRSLAEEEEYTCHNAVAESMSFVGKSGHLLPKV